MLLFCSNVDIKNGPARGVTSTPADHFTTATLLGGTAVPQEPIRAQDDHQSERILPAGPLSRSQRYRRRKLAERLGVPVDAIPDRRGHHGNHPKGRRHPRWNAESRMLSEHGYIKVRVGAGHPLADPNGYAYEHLLVWAAASRPLPGPDELIHHKDEDKANNRLDNLELRTRSSHATHHNADRDRDESGRFVPATTPKGAPPCAAS
jgi:hypothetical protein